MKHLKLFEEFIDFNLDWVSAKMNELSDLVSDFSNIEFKYHIEKVKDNEDLQGLLVIELTATDANITLIWTIDLDSPSITIEEIEGDEHEKIYDSKLESIEQALDLVEKNIQDLFDINERVKAQRYKGKKIPGKYLAGPHPGKMKKEIDKYRGKSEYKKEWDADYTTGKGGKGKRVKTKKSSATKAYQKMFGDK
jgi:hypothetical protein